MKKEREIRDKISGAIVAFYKKNEKWPTIIEIGNAEYIALLRLGMHGSDESGIPRATIYGIKIIINKDKYSMIKVSRNRP